VTTTTAPASATATSAAATLPRTGFDDWLIAGVGAGLLGAGIALRLRTT
jgi:LPXTG-motif cell wall-anchored protein